MLRTFNCGVGFIIITSQKDKKTVIKLVIQNYGCNEIGAIENGEEKVALPLDFYESIFTTIECFIRYVSFSNRKGIVLL